MLYGWHFATILEHSFFGRWIRDEMLYGILGECNLFKGGGVLRVSPVQAILGLAFDAVVEKNQGDDLAHSFVSDISILPNIT